jgi:hypothetical protein
MTITIVSFGEGTDRAGSGFTSDVSLGTVQVGDEVWALARWEGTGLTVGNVTLTNESNLASVGSAATNQGPVGKSFQWFSGTCTAAEAKTVAWAPPSGTTAAYALCAWLVRGANGADGTPRNNTGTGTTASVSVTTALSNAAVLVFVNNGTDGDMSAPGSGFTQRTLADIYGYDAAQDDNNVGAAGTRTVDCTVAAAGDWVISAVAINSDDGAAGGTSSKFNKLVGGGILLNGSLIG